MVLELGLGVERLRRRGGDNRGRRRRRGASGKSDKNGAGDKDAKVFGHLRVLPAPPARGRVPSGVRRIAEKRDSINSAQPIAQRSAPDLQRVAVGCAHPSCLKAPRIRGASKACPELVEGNAPAGAAGPAT